jgi:CheY-like chemotaxis protein
MAGLNVVDYRINLTSAVIMLIDAGQHSMNILSQIFLGFEVNVPLKFAKPEEALMALKHTAVDLIIVEADMPGTDGYAFTKALRHSSLESNRYVPVIITSGHTPRSKVASARDCGANYFLAKPLNPRTVLDRIAWVAEANRPFIETDGYIGPERRFQRIGPRAGAAGRRQDDLTSEIGEATTPTLSESVIDNLVKPQRVTL